MCTFRILPFLKLLMPWNTWMAVHLCGIENVVLVFHSLKRLLTIRTFERTIVVCSVLLPVSYHHPLKIRRLRYGNILP